MINVQTMFLSIAWNRTWAMRWGNIFVLLGTALPSAFMVSLFWRRRTRQVALESTRKGEHLVTEEAAADVFAKATPSGRSAHCFDTTSPDVSNSHAGGVNFYEHCIVLHLLDIATSLSPRTVFSALPAVSRVVLESFKGELRRWVAEGKLWPQLAPVYAASSSEGLTEIETLTEATALRRDVANHLERLFLRSLQENWRGRALLNMETCAQDGITRSKRPTPFRKVARPCPSAFGALSDEVLGGPVLWSVRKGHHYRGVSEVSWLLHWRADANETDQNGWTPLIWAATRNSIELCETLLRGRADVNRVGCEGSSALSTACRCSNLELVRVLLEAGALPNQVLIGSGNLDSNVGDDITELLRKKRQEMARRVKTTLLS